MIGLTIDLDSEIPVYRQIAKELRGLIARGLLAPGAELPSVRRLGTSIGVNQNTVAKAYRILETEGLVELRRGASARVGDNPHLPSPDLEEAEQRIADAISRLVLADVDRSTAQRLVARVLDRFYPEGPG